MAFLRVFNRENVPFGWFELVSPLIEKMFLLKRLNLHPLYVMEATI